MNSTVPRPTPPVTPRFFFGARPVIAALVLVALMAGGTAAKQATGGEASAAATKRLFEAVYNNNLGAVQTSIAAGADITATNESGLMAVDVAVDRRHFQIAQFLLSIRNLRRANPAETAPPPPAPVAPPAPAVAGPMERSKLAALPAAAVAPSPPWPTTRPNPFDPATQAPAPNLPLVGPVFGLGVVPTDAKLPPANVPAPLVTAGASSEPEPTQPSLFSRLTGLFHSGGEAPAKPIAPLPGNTAQDVETQGIEVPAKTAPRASVEKPRSALSSPVALARRNPPAPQLPMATSGNPFDSAAAAPGSALPIIGAIQEPTAAPASPAAKAPSIALQPKQLQIAEAQAQPMAQEKPPAANDVASVGETDINAAAHKSPEARPGFFSRLTSFFKPNIELPTVIAEPTPILPAPAPHTAAPSSPTPTLSVPSTQGRREVEIVSLPRPAAVEITAMEKHTEIAAAPPVTTPATHMVQKPVERTPLPGFFERLAHLLKSDEMEPAASAELSDSEAPPKLYRPVISTPGAEQPAAVPLPARSDNPQTAPPPPTPTEITIIAEKPAADTALSKTSPFDPKAAPQRLNIPVIGEIYGPGSAVPQSEPALAPEPRVEVAEAPMAAPQKEVPTTSEEPVPPAKSISLAETKEADETPGFLNRLKGLFKPTADGLMETPPAPPARAETASAPTESPLSGPEADQSVVVRPATKLPLPTPEAPPTAPTPLAPLETASAPSEAAPPIPQTPGSTTVPPMPESAKPAGLFQRLVNLLKPDGDKAPTTKTAAREESAAKKPVETAHLLARPTPPLEGIILTLGESVRLGKDPGQGMDKAERHQPCLKKKDGKLMFCIRPIDWPSEIKHHFDVSSFMYRGNQAIARHDEGEATSYYTLFKTESFDAVIAYYERRFGKPTEIWDRLVKPMAAPQQPNPTILWRSVDPATHTISVLEVRKFDDTRGGFPDLLRGAILLRREDAQHIFPRLSPLELMSVN